jgi:aarF domain-containing kinase
MVEASKRWQKEREAAPVESKTSQPAQDELRQQQDDTDTAALASSLAEEVESQKKDTPYEMRESRVPSSRFGRLWQYGGLATSMAFGAMGEGIRRIAGGTGEGSLMLSEGNMNRLVAKLSRMRGAALKLGQMISFQDSKVLPATINTVLQRVQDSADYMPASQRDKVLIRNLGPDWRDLFSEFADRPFAAASIGQVHKATLKSNGKAVAVKIQYPGVRNSIDSDLNNLSLLLTASQLLPRGLFLDKTIANARTELGWECDYEREAKACIRFKTELLADESDIFAVPTVYTEASGPDVLTAEFMHGTGVTKIADLSQDERNWIGSNILRLCLRELMEWQFMQTDPNWTNFLYNRSTQNLELLDFGASRDFPKEFVEPYVALLIAASRGDRDACVKYSIDLGYLTGAESKEMLRAHVDSILTLAEPFVQNAPEVYDFEDQTITDRVRANIGLMLRERMAPPPEETYSLHRKLSGAFLLCARLRSKVEAREMFATAVKVWEGREKSVKL